MGVCSLFTKGLPLITKIRPEAWNWLTVRMPGSKTDVAEEEEKEAAQKAAKRAAKKAANKAARQHARRGATPRPRIRRPRRPRHIR